MLDGLALGEAMGHLNHMVRIGEAVRETDARGAWRFRAAPADQRMMAWERIESAWPVHGSVLVVKGSVYCVAGRSGFLDGGLRFYLLDADTGRMLSICKIDETDPRSGENIQQLQSGWCGLTMPVANPDILTSDGQRVFVSEIGGSRLLVWNSVPSSDGTAPDFVMGPDADPAVRNVLGVVHKVGLEIGGAVIGVVPPPRSPCPPTSRAR